MNYFKYTSHLLNIVIKVILYQYNPLRVLELHNFVRQLNIVLVVRLYIVHIILKDLQTVIIFTEFKFVYNVMDWFLQRFLSAPQ